VKRFKHIYYSFLVLIFQGCDYLYTGQSGIGGNINSAMKPLMIRIVDFIYPLLGFIGLIVLAISINTLFITKNNPNESPVSKLLGGTMEFVIAIILITSKTIVTALFGK
jgi:hypothetical protein